MLIVFSLSVCLSVSLSISLYVYSVYDLYNNNNTSQRAVMPCGWGVKAGMVRVWVAAKTV